MLRQLELVAPKFGSYSIEIDHRLDHIGPETLGQARTAERRLRIWSVACARGEVPATIALVLAEHPALLGWDWRIVATDLDTETLTGAERGLYGNRAVAQVPPLLLETWFTSSPHLGEASLSWERRAPARLFCGRLDQRYQVVQASTC